MDVGITTIGDVMMLVFIAGTMMYLDPLLGIVHAVQSISLPGASSLIYWQKKVPAHIPWCARGHLRGETATCRRNVFRGAGGPRAQNRQGQETSATSTR